MTTVIRPATINDLPAIDALRKQEGNALGFMPIQVYKSVVLRVPVDGRRRWEYQRLTVTTDNDDLTGFCFSSFNDNTAHIFQIVVRSDARRWTRASMLEGDVRQRANALHKAGVSCRVAFDLESNLFWRAIGYIPIKQVVSTWLNQRESQSKRPLWHYHLDLGLPLFSGLVLPDIRSAEVVL